MNTEQAKKVLKRVDELVARGTPVPNQLVIALADHLREAITEAVLRPERKRAA